MDISEFALPSDALETPLMMGAWPFNGFMQQLEQNKKDYELSLTTKTLPGEKPLEKLRKMDLIRIAASDLHDIQKKFTAQEMQEHLQGSIDRQTVSAMINRLYSTKEFISKKKNDAGRIIYMIGELRVLSEKFQAMGFDEAIEYYLNQDVNITVSECIDPDFDF